MAPYLNHFILLQTISLVYLLVTVRCTGSSPTHDEECLALVQFKQSIVHQNDPACAATWFQMLDSWQLTSNVSNTGSDCCLWNGVTCSNDMYVHVIGLDLSEGFLCGHINSNSTLFSLVHLQSLNLAMNDFSESQIPSEIGQLKQLRSLNLSNSGFSGQIPHEISQLMQLSSLDLSRNSLELHSPSFKNLVQNLTELEELHLSGVDISSSVPQFLANFSSLRSISLQDCLLQNEFPTAILQLPNLKLLDVASNINLTGSFPEFRNKSLLEHVNLALTGFFGIVPESISNLNRLKFLRLTQCSFSGHIPRSLSNLTQLTRLGLGSNKFTGFVPSFVSLSKLNFLELDGNKFEKGSFPNWLGKLTELNELYVYNMNISSEIPPFLGNLTKLSVIVMAGNSLYGNIPSSFFNLTQLRKLDLGENQLEGPISRSFSNFKSLEALSLYQNNFSGSVDIDIFQGLNKLVNLMLSDNNISLVATNNYTNTTLPELSHLEMQSCNLKEVPSFLRFQSKLTALYLGHNKIDGLLPVWLWNTSQETLEVIDLSYNSITGFHQHSHLFQHKLKQLIFYHNKIEGLVPAWIWNNQETLDMIDLSYNSITGFQQPPHLLQHKLRGLFLSNNKIDGLVPTWIWNNSQETLEVIDLSFNSIVGFQQHPHFLSWRHLKGYDISNNRVRGHLPIPPQTVVAYDVSNNNLTGEIPPLICEVKSLRLLDFSFNNLSGVLPPCLGNLSNSLLVLNLRQNNFHGIMMNSFMHGSMLRSIDLSENGFTGQLPRSLTNCTNLEVLSLGDNSFDGVFPSWLGTLAKLQVLILRSNKFYGPIQVSTSVSSHFPKLRIMDLSNNHFSGQLQPNYFKSMNTMKFVYAGTSSVMESEVISGPLKSNLQYSMTLIHKGVRTEYTKILTIFTAIDLSCNNFEGEIPLSLQDLRGLESLNLSNNHFSGRVFPSLGHLKNLESLDLSRNELSGKIPQQLVQLGFLAIFNMSYNNLDGLIPKGKQFNTFENSSYMGNPQLCGQPLSKECQGSKASRLPPASNASESLLPSERIDWIIIFCGVGSGLVVGIVLGNFLHTKYSDRFRKKKDKWVQPLRNTKRN